jgi:hypothetical protein
MLNVALTIEEGKIIGKSLFVTTQPTLSESGFSGLKD